MRYCEALHRVFPSLGSKFGAQLETRKEREGHARPALLRFSRFPNVRPKATQAPVSFVVFPHVSLCVLCCVPWLLVFRLLSLSAFGCNQETVNCLKAHKENSHIICVIRFNLVLIFAFCWIFVFPSLFVIFIIFQTAQK